MQTMQEIELQEDHKLGSSFI